MIQYRDTDVPEFKDKVIPIFEWEIPIDNLKVFKTCDYNLESISVHCILKKEVYLPNNNLTLHYSIPVLR